MPFEDILNPIGVSRLNLVGLNSQSLYFTPSKVTSNPSIDMTASSDIFSSAKSYYTIDLVAGVRYGFYIYGNTTDGSTIIANSTLDPVVLNSESNDGSTHGTWDIIVDFVPTTSGKYYIKPAWLSNIGTVNVYKFFPDPINSNGTIGNDVLVGGGGSDTINGLDGNDMLTGNGGNDSIDGGSGTDVAIYSGVRSHFSVLKTSTEPLAKLAALGDLIAGIGKMEGRGRPFLA